MTALRSLVDSALAEVLNEHPKYFTPHGKQHFRTTALREIMAAFRAATRENESGESRDESATPPKPAGPQYVIPGSDHGRAWCELRFAGGAVSPFIAGGQYLIPAEAAIPAVWAFAEAPAREFWPTITDRQQIAAWLGFFKNTLPGVPRRPIVTTDGNLGRSIRVPWPWPPCKDGSLSHQQEMEPVDEEIEG